MEHGLGGGQSVGGERGFLHAGEEEADPCKVPPAVSCGYQNILPWPRHSVLSGCFMQVYILKYGYRTLASQ